MCSFVVTEEIDCKMDKPPIQDDDTTNANGNINLRFGWGRCRPKCLQFFNNSKWLLFFFCMANLSQAMAVNGFVGTIVSSLERRFGLQSTQSGLIVSAYEMGTIPALIIISIFGIRFNRPLWIGIGLLLCSIGSIIFLIPHYATGPYNYNRGDSEQLCQANVSDGCSGGNAAENGLGNYMGVLMFGNILHGIGTTPLYTLGVAYLDDMLDKDTSSLFIGIFYAMGVLGPAIGYIGGGFLLDIYTDFDSGTSPSVTSKDLRWVGAWWLGFWINAVVLLFTVIPITGFPVDLPGAKKVRQNKVSEAHGDSEAITSRPDFGSHWKDSWTMMKLLFTNIPFVCLTVLGICEASIIQGFTAFGPKYVQNQFAVDGTFAAILFGIVSVPGGAGGTVVGGYIVKKFQMLYDKILRMEFAMNIVVLVLAVEFLLQCENLPYAGVNVGYNRTSKAVSMEDQCNLDCGCNHTNFEPVCGQDQQNLMYFSPCHAGCQAFEITADVKNYFNCTCIAVNDTTKLMATSTVCSTECILLGVFLTIFFLSMFFTFYVSICNVNATLRCVTSQQKPTAIAIQWIFLRLLGTVPGPIIFGSALDGSCILWDETCGVRGSCLLYDNTYVGYYMLLICGVLKVLSVIFCGLAWKLYKKPTSSGVTKGESTGDVVANQDDRMTHL